MSNTAFYVKDMNVSDDDEDQDMSHEDIWDDRKLNDAYDKALKLANAEVARRLAMATNSETSNKQEVSQNKNEQSKGNAPRNQKKKLKWKPGMPCRAVYEVDGIEYEACVLNIVNDKKCYVRFLGYNNTEVVQTCSLKASKGEEARARQIEEALVAEQQPMEYTSQSSQAGSMAGDPDRNLLEAESASKHSKMSKKKKQSGKQKQTDGFDLPNMPFQMPNMAMLMNSGSHEMPLPPPPLPTAGRDDEQQAVSAMLLSWYMSGYYTGLYQGMKRSQESGRNK